MANQEAIFAGGCFWCTEAVFNDIAGVHAVESGYIGGAKPNPTYREVCSGTTGHAEAIKIGFDDSVVSYSDLLDIFFATHDPTQLNRQGNDIGSQYRSAIYTTSDAQAQTARDMAAAYQGALAKAGHSAAITTEIAPLGPFYYAEDYHQQYLAKNPAGYCSIGGTGVSCPVGLTV